MFNQSVGICDQGNKPKHVNLPNFNKSRKYWSFEEVREKKSTLLLEFNEVASIFMPYNIKAKLLDGFMKHFRFPVLINRPDKSGHARIFVILPGYLRFS